MFASFIAVGTLNFARDQEGRKLIIKYLGSTNSKSNQPKKIQCQMRSSSNQFLSGPLHKSWCLNLNDNTLYLISFVLIFPNKGFFT